jgi:hypothetical protein
MNKVSPVFKVLFALALVCFIGAGVEAYKQRAYTIKQSSSGWLQGGIVCTLLGAGGAGYNRWHNGTWFTDNSGGK